MGTPVAIVRISYIRCGVIIVGCVAVEIRVSDFVFRLRLLRRRFNSVFLPQNTPRPARSGNRQRDATAERQQDHLEAGPQTNRATQVVLLHGVGLQRVVRV